MRARVAACGVAMLWASVAMGQLEFADQGELVVGQVQEVTIENGKGLSYAVKVDAAGLLTVATRGEGGDVVLQVTDADNQVLPSAQADDDIGGVMCNEQLVTAVPYAETWHVRAANVGDAPSTVKLTVGFVAFPPVAREPDADGRPTLARAIDVGQNVEDHLSTADFDLSDWYKVVAPADGRLVVMSKGDDALDIAIRVVTGEGFDQQVAVSDNDMDEQTASEAAVASVKAGETYYIQINVVVESQGDYTLGTSFVAF